MTLRTLRDAERYLEGFINRERIGDFDYERLGLGRIRALLDAIGHPEREFDCVHVTGSKGKGSVALATEALLRAAGRRVGTYTSPHLESWLERFRVDGASVDSVKMVAALELLRPAIEAQSRDEELRPSWFDVTTALGLALFSEHKVDAGVIEVGIGGRLDSTNTVRSRVSVITTVELEHTDKLGDSLEEIACEKAGILRPGVPVVHGPLAAEAYAALAARAVAENAPLHEVSAVEIEQTEAGLRFALPDGRQIESPLLGRHHATNLAIAVRASELFLGRELSQSELASLGELRLPARMERFGRAILDSAHTVRSARALREGLGLVWPDRRWVLVVAMSADKNAAAILSELAEPTRACVVSRGEPTRSMALEDLVALAWASGIEHVEAEPEPGAALARAAELADPDDLIVVTGSFYFAGAVRALLETGAAPV